jgi:hypothetical protein
MLPCCAVLLQIHEKYPEETDRRIRFAKVRLLDV